jgi:DNA polymerase alpha subunit B
MIHAPEPPPIWQDGHLSLWFVNGPYAFGSTLSYKPLQALIHRVKVEKPHVLIMGGPFIDCNNEDVKSGELVFETPDKQIRCLTDKDLQKHLMSYLESELPSRTQIVVLPSLKDIHSMFPLPQPPMAASHANQCGSSF